MSKYMAYYEIYPEELAQVFFQMGWAWAAGEVYGCPTASDIEAKLSELLRHMIDNKEFYVLQSGRLALARDPEFPNSFEIFLQIGHIDPSGEEDQVSEVAA